MSKEEKEQIKEIKKLLNFTTEGTSLRINNEVSKLLLKYINKLEQKESILDKIKDKLKEDIENDYCIEERIGDAYITIGVKEYSVKPYAREILNILEGEKTNEILESLNGNKILIIGNHDENFLKDKKFNKDLFQEICYYKELKINKTKIVLFHYPIIDWNGKFNGSVHLYGHVHTIISTDTEHMDDMQKQYNCFNVGIDVHKRILNLEEFI